MARHRTNPALALAAMAGLTLAAAAPAQAAFVVTISEGTGGVTVAGSGALNIDGLTLNATAFVPSSGLRPQAGQFIVGGSFDVYRGITPPANSFGSSPALFTPTSVSGSSFIISLASEALGVPRGYTSGTAFTTGMVFAGQTLASMTLVPGSYVYSWGSGQTADNVTVEILRPSTAVPEPATALLLGAGLLGLAGLRRRA